MCVWLFFIFVHLGYLFHIGVINIMGTYTNNIHNLVFKLTLHFLYDNNNSNNYKNNNNDNKKSRLVSLSLGVFSGEGKALYSLLSLSQWKIECFSHRLYLYIWCVYVCASMLIFSKTPHVIESSFFFAWFKVFFSVSSISIWNLILFSVSFSAQCPFSWLFDKNLLFFFSFFSLTNHHNRNEKKNIHALFTFIIQLFPYYYWKTQSLHDYDDLHVFE